MTFGPLSQSTYKQTFCYLVYAVIAAMSEEPLFSGQDGREPAREAENAAPSDDYIYR